MSKILAIDYGTKNLGLAVSDELEMVAKREKILSVSSDDNALDKVVEFVNNEEIEKILIGLPLDNEGNLTKAAENVREFSSRLQDELPNIEIIEWNEFFSSSIVKMNSENRKWLRKHEDSEVARMLLQEYLDNKN